MAASSHRRSAIHSKVIVVARRKHEVIRTSGGDAVCYEVEQAVSTRRRTNARFWAA